MKRKVLAMLLLVALMLSAFAPAASAQPIGVQPFSPGTLEWTVHDQTVAVGTQFVDVRFAFENPGVVAVQMLVEWDSTYLQLPDNRSLANIFQNASPARWGEPNLTNLSNAPLGGPVALMWDFGTHNQTADGYFTMRFELLPAAVAGTEANVSIEVANPNLVINADAQVVPVIGDDGYVRVVDLNPVPMWFDGNGGLPAIQPVVAFAGDSVTWGTLTTNPSVVRPTRTGYTFLGWSLTAGGTVIPPATLWTVAVAEANPIVFAVWDPVPEIIVYVDMNFMGNGGLPNDQAVRAALRADTTFGTLDTNPVVMTPTRLPSVANPNGYRFLGWSTTQNGSTGIIDPTTPWNSFSPRTVWAQWDPLTGPEPPDYIAIAFYAPDANNVAHHRQVILADLQADGVTYVLRTPGPTTPTHNQNTIFTFDDWFTAGGVSLGNVQPFNYNSPRVFYARWDTDVDPVPMWFDGNGGLPAIQPVVAFVGDSVTWGTLDTNPRVVRPTRAGYTFLGWSLTASGTVIPDSTVWNVAAAEANPIVFAVWDPVPEVIVYVDMNFMGNGGLPNDQAVRAALRADTTFGTLDTNPVVMTPTRLPSVANPNGYRFLGWSTTQNGSSGIIDPTTPWNSFSPRTIWAQWDPLTGPEPPDYIAIAFYAPDANNVAHHRQVILADLQADGVTYVLRIPGPTTPTHNLDPVFTFVDWFTAGGVSLGNVQPFNYNSPRVFHARWDSDAEPVAMWFVGNGGSPAEQVVTAQVGDGVTFGNLVATGTYRRVTTPRHPSGYAFLGWSTTQDGSSGIIANTDIWNAASPRIVYAQWDPNGIDIRITFPMNFMGNGGLPADQAVTVYFATGMTFGSLDTDPVVVRPEHPLGHRFLGWSMTQNGPIIPANQLWNANNLAYRTVWAQWETGPDIFPEYIEVAFHGNGGTPLRQPILAQYNVGASTFFASLLTQPTAPYRHGYTFRGWYTAPVGGVPLVDGDPLTFHGQREFWAQYDSNSIPMWFVGNGGDPVNQVVVVTIGTNPASEFGNLVTYPRVVVPRHPDGYQFLGWSETPDGAVIPANTPWTAASPRIVFARWNPNGTDTRVRMEMEFVSNNLTPEVQEVEVWLSTTSTFGTLDTNPVVQRPTHPLGLRFLGWSATPTGTPVVIIADDAPWLPAPWSPTRVYARWSIEPEIDPPYIAIGFYGNGGTPPRQVFLADLYTGSEFFGSLQDQPVDPTRGQLDFLGWFPTLTGGVRLEDGDALTYQSPRVFFARWEIHHLEFRFDGDNSNPNPRPFDYIRIPVLLNQPIDWTVPGSDEAYIFAIDCVLSTGIYPYITQGHAFWGWFDDETLDYGETNRPNDSRRRPMVGTTGWDISDPGFVFTQADFDAMGDGYVITFTAIFSLWGDANDDDEVDTVDVLRINQWIFDEILRNLGEPVYFDYPINLRASNVTVDGLVDTVDVLRINQWIFDEILRNLGEDAYFETVLGRP